MSTVVPGERREISAACKVGGRFPMLCGPRYPVHRVADRLESRLHVLVEQVHPEKMIRFGSYAHRHPGEHGDFDLLIIRQGLESEQISNLEIRRAFDTVPGVPPPFTILSKTPDRITNPWGKTAPTSEVRQGRSLP